MPPDGPLLAAQDLDVRYGPIQALRGCSLAVGRGETVAVVGANGAGKTTLLRALSAMLPLHAGRISFRGQVVHGRAPHRLARDGLLHVPEGRGVLGTLSVFDNLRISYDIRPCPRSFDDAVADVFARFPRLAERRDQRAGNMSGGEQQMLALARAVINPPEILLLDEPSLGLSPVMVREAYRILRGFKEQAMTILLVEQNVRLALRFADRAYVLKQGQFVLDGPSERLMSDPSMLDYYLGAGA
jgi:branched-chain amino acid transport system ATP-binding protein